MRQRCAMRTRRLALEVQGRCLHGHLSPDRTVSIASMTLIVESLIFDHPTPLCRLFFSE